MLKKALLAIFIVVVVYVGFQLIKPCGNMVITIVNNHDELIHIIVKDSIEEGQKNVVLVDREIPAHKTIKEPVLIYADVVFDITVKDQQDNILNHRQAGYESAMFSFKAKITFDGKDIFYNSHHYHYLLWPWYAGNVVLKCAI